MAGRSKVTRSSDAFRGFAGSLVFGFVTAATFTFLIAACGGSSGSSNAAASITMDLSAITKSTARAQSSTSATAVIQHISIDVSAPDIPKDILWEWDQNGNNAAAAPNVAGLTVPQGSGRMVQVIVVMGSNSSGGGGSAQFLYGDSVTNIGAGDNAVGVTVKSVGSAGSGNIIGRYLTTATSGPSGQVSMYLQAAVGKRTMLVHQSEIFNGWFRLFGLMSNSSGAAFVYKLDDGTVMFGGPTTIDSAALVSSGSTKAARMVTPAGYTNNCGSGTPCVSASSGTVTTVGFFGPGAPSSSQLCYNAVAGPMSGLYADAGAVTPVVWAGPSLPTAAQAGIVAGGASAALCSLTSGAGSTAYVDRLTLKESLAINGDGALGFMGPFLNLSSGSSGSGGGTQFVQSSSVTAAGLPVTWKFVPGAEQAIDGVEVFYKINAPPAAGASTTGDTGNKYRAGEGTACDKLISLYGFTSAGRFSTSTLTATIPGVTAANQSNLEAFVCPYKQAGLFSQLTGTSSTYFTSAAQLYSYGNSNGNGNSNGGMNQATQLSAKMVIADSSVTTMHNGVCVPMQVVPMDSNGNSAMLNISSPFQFSVTISDSATNTTAYSDATCTNTTPATFMMNSLGGPTLFYVKSAGSTVRPITVSVSSATPALGSVPYTLNIDSTIGGTPVTAKVATFKNFTLFSCNPFILEVVDASGIISAPAATQGIYFNELAASPGTGIIPGLSFYTNPNCTSMFYNYLLASATVSAHTVAGSYQYGGSAGVFAASPMTLMGDVLSGTTVGLDSTTSKVTYTPPGAPAKLGLWLPNASMQNSVYSAFTGTCTALNAGLQDSAGNWTATTSATSVVFSSAGPLTFYSNLADCTGSTNGAASVTMAIAIGNNAATNGNQVYFTVDSIGATSIDATVSGTTVSGSLSFTGQAPVASKFLFQLPGESWSAGLASVTGTAIGQAPGTNFSVQIMALTPNNQIDTAFSGAYPLTSSYAANFNALPATVMFSGGIATFTTQLVHTTASPSAFSIANPNFSPASYTSNSLLSNNSSMVADHYLLTGTLPQSTQGNACNPIMVVTTTASGVPKPLSSMGTVAIALTNLTAWSTSSCNSTQLDTSGSLTLSLATSDTNQVFYVKPVTTGGVTIAPLNSGTLTAGGGNLATAAGSATLTYGFNSVAAQKAGSFLAGVCMPFLLQTLSDQLTSEKITGASFNINSATLTCDGTNYSNVVYPTSSCSGASVPAIPNGGNFAVGFLMVPPAAVGASSCNVNFSSFSGQTFTNTLSTLSVGPAW